MRSRRSVTVNIRQLNIGVCPEDANYETKSMATVPASSRGLEPLQRRGSNRPGFWYFRSQVALMRFRSA